MIALALAAALAVQADAPPASGTAPVMVSSAPIDPARLGAAHTLAEKLVPAGTYQKLMNGGMAGMNSRMTDGMLDLPMRQLLGSSGLSQEQIAKLGNGTIRQVMLIMDPHFQERTQISMKTMFEGMGVLFAKFEPQLRDGLAEAYARRFDVAQLGELNHFFESPTGSAFAAQQLTMMNDPAVQAKMQTVGPALMQQMPALIKKMQEATASLPKAKTAADLTDADRTKLAALIGVSPDKLKGQPATKAKAP